MRKRAKQTIALAFLSSSLLVSCQETPPLKENPPTTPSPSKAGESYGKGGLGEEKFPAGEASSGRPAPGEAPKSSELK